MKFSDSNVAQALSLKNSSAPSTRLSSSQAALKTTPVSQPATHNSQLATRYSAPSAFNSSAPSALNSSAISALKSRRAFTLVELLVVLGIIVVLIALLFPAIVGAQKRAYITATNAELSTIGTALAAYHNDFNMYPSSSLVESGNIYPDSVSGNSAIPQYAAYEYLAEALLGYLPGDMDNAPSSSVGNSNGWQTGSLEQCKGFCMNPYNKVYGPYLDIGVAYIVKDPNPLDSNAPAYYIADSFPPSVSGNPMPVLYYSSSGTPTNGETIFAQTSGGPFASGSSGSSYIFNEQDNACATGPVASAMGGAPTMTSSVFTNFTVNPSSITTNNTYPMYQFLQLIGANGNATNTFSAGQNILGANGYLLMSAGLDQTYFDSDDIVYGGQ
ncbi:MAG TPA: prepilin-type N-terminal cleavage/methylation domain-containing protein [Phycisphaerae bacterium]|nr:prepilin-type N-terminal cleavage/methylation domain-containing protein [Phycisphaerae bacterium]